MIHQLMESGSQARAERFANYEGINVHFSCTWAYTLRWCVLEDFCSFQNRSFFLYCLRALSEVGS